MLKPLSPNPYPFWSNWQWIDYQIDCAAAEAKVELWRLLHRHLAEMSAARKAREEIPTT